MLGLRQVGPQQVELASLLLAEDNLVPIYTTCAILEPRRASKTTTIWAVLLGLCATRPDFKVVVTAQTYVKARERFLEVYRVMLRTKRFVNEYDVKRGAGDMSIEWPNGSRLWVVTPEGGAFRGDGADRIMFDEAQEHGPDATADLLGGALALMDTKFAEDADLTDEDTQSTSQLIVTGTTGEARAGMLWDHLERGRAGRIGVLEYALPEGTPVAFPANEPDGVAGAAAGWHIRACGKWVLNEPALLAAHPGIGTLTTLRTIRERFDALGLPEFSREYGGLWPFDLNSRAIAADDWSACRAPTQPPYPTRYALAFDVAPDQSSAALVAAWRDAEGRPWGEVIEHRSGDDWLAKAVWSRTKERRELPVAYDNIGPNQAVADRLAREARPRPKLVLLSTRDITAAAAQLSQDIVGRRARHVSDPALDAAADIATRRSIGDGSWAWGRRRAANEGGDIAPLVAWTNALRAYDTMLARRDQQERERPEGDPDEGMVSSLTV